MASETILAGAEIKGAGILAITSPDRLYKDWCINGEKSQIAKLLKDIDRNAPIVTVLDGHPATLSWIGSVAGHRVRPLGIDDFGQCGGLDELYRTYGLDTDSIVAAFKS